ncbi:TIR domain-containing adapter molecule 1 [Kryptolebias marmoratus]|uniref:TIR domain-containing adapter molecule 1-like n=1 Tax=Kryptolebias marmoratus TaxID=37003 RepID=A0A3Q3EZN8_KRYMA|nr:TIR domain-containing adapter molecule 1 [Kryptolebias marmoratus]XP_024862983.1 TIR domain-containing adapter molecule 1 [Kryptolebias marmoratus]
MSHAGWEDQGTGLGEAFDVLVKAPSERLISLVIQLGDAPEDGLVQALCLIILRRGEQALEKLQMLRDNPVAKHLVASGHASGGKLEDFGAHCGRFREQSGESLSSLARIFKVLSEQRLCEVSLRNLAYRRALSSDCFRTNSCGSLDYHQLVEEAKVVCGPQFAEWMGSTDLKSESSLDPNTSLYDKKATLKVFQDESSSIRYFPSPLLESLSEPSYPTHLEISVPPTVSYQGDKRAPEASGSPTLNPSVLSSEHEAKTVPGQPPSAEPEHKSNQSSLFGANKDSKTDETLESMSCKLHSRISQSESPTQPSTGTFTLPSPQHISLPKTPVLKNLHGTGEEDEEVFYAFVILHAPEDEELAETMKAKLETVIGSEGATFSEEFAVPGKSALKCVEDAIDNSAYTFLLLTRNFNTKMLEVKTNIALINSINKVHKYNTVIPLLPLDNCMPRQEVPRVLQTLVPLDERKSFMRKIQKTLSPARIEAQRRIWTEEQRVKRLNRLKQEAERLSLYTEQHLRLGSGVPPLWAPQPNIHIENAKYIMIGNDSTMTVDLGRNANSDGSMSDN